MEQVLITGMGVVNAIGHQLEDFRASLKQGKSGITAVTDDHIALKKAALLTDFDLQQSLDALPALPQPLRRHAFGMARREPLSIQLGVSVAMQAWQQANLAESPPADRQRVSLVVAGQNINQGYIYQQHERYKDELDYLPPRYGLQFMDSNHIGILSELLQIEGEGFMAGAASASGNVGIIQAVRLIQWGLADICLVVGALADMSSLEVQAFKSMGGLSASDVPCCPFDQDHDGFTYGQGSACLVLESAASAEKRQVKGLASVLGMATNLDANRLSNPSVSGEVRAMQGAMTQANVMANDVQYINAHGTASVLGDETEVAAINQLFAQSRPWVNSTKSLTGHCLYSAGVVEAVATVVQMGQGFVHPNLNLRQPIDDTCAFVGAESQAADIKVAISNSFGFGGINSSIVLGRV